MKRPMVTVSKDDMVWTEDACMRKIRFSAGRIGVAGVKGMV